jgi:hypothetical protein
LDIVYIKRPDYIYTCKMMARVSVPFTEGCYCDGGERPNTELADNSSSICRKKTSEEYKYEKKVDCDNFNADNNYFLLYLLNQRYNPR